MSNEGRRLDTLAAWRDHGGPVNSRAWAEGRSARELARAWMDGEALEQVSALLGSVPAFDGLVLDRGIAEKETSFDTQHDLLLVGGTPDGTVVVGIEGKTDEPFDARLDAWVASAGAFDDPARATERLDTLTRLFFGATIDADPLLATLRFQLLAALAGTLADAREHAARRAVLLVHEFETAWTADDLHRRNREDLEAFLWRLMPGVGAVGDDRAWIAGPRTILGDGEWFPEAVDVYVGKLVSSTRES